MIKKVIDDDFLEGVGRSQKQAKIEANKTSKSAILKRLKKDGVKANKSQNYSNKPTLTTSQKIRIAAGFEQAVLKVTSYGKSVDKIKAHLAYISRKNELVLEDGEGRKILTKKEVDDLVDSWQSIYFDGRSNSRHTFHFILSVPPGTKRDVFKRAATEFLSDEFGGKNELVFAQHDDTEHPHIHVALCLRGINGKKLDPRKQVLNNMRKNFAKKCREHGIMLDASRRFERGLAGKSTHSKLVQMRSKRGITPHVDKQLISQVKSEMTNPAMIVDTGAKARMVRNESIKNQFYDASKTLYQQYNKQPNNPEFKNNLKVSKLLFDYSKSMPNDISRDEKLKEILIEKEQAKSFSFIELNELVSQLEDNISKEKSVTQELDID